MTTALPLPTGKSSTTSPNSKPPHLLPVRPPDATVSSALGGLFLPTAHCSYSLISHFPGKCRFSSTSCHLYLQCWYNLPLWKLKMQNKGNNAEHTP